ncbi:MAG: GNAT family N-acetyltransferase [Thalassolituus sp.]|uniref:GNAT family N-acetyltransferase n=2 Tax=Oceanospirillaceae TaxID=135620 RepID=UPI00042DCFED|nr:GNAT family N-acetyltransferase [Thalassolituus oleivorans]AHK15752.1 acetyltransferase [Thalassolituus oleivorans R6-15]MBQ0780245.1 GNAT family N-acetyltransferase [Thalassolituus oleivorans]
MEIVTTDWSKHRDALRDIRRRVFIEEQGVPEELEWDDDDLKATHFIVYDGKRPVACARLLNNGHFGRMAVLREHRQQHWGSRLLRAIEQHARSHLPVKQIKANVQTHAFGFYHRNGFTANPEFFLDAGIPHLPMHKAIGSPHQTTTLTPKIDSERYQLNDLLSISSWLQIALQGGPVRVFLLIEDLTHPLWSDTTLLNAISRYLRASRQRQVEIILRAEHGSQSSHPLIKLQQRLSSRINIKVNSTIKHSQVLLESWGWLTLMDENKGFASMSDTARTRHYVERAKTLLQQATPLKEGRRLMI